MVVSKVGKRKKKDAPVPVKEAPPQIPETPIIRFVLLVSNKYKCQTSQIYNNNKKNEI